VVETSVWSAEEIEAYQQAMMKYDKDFFLVSKQVNIFTVVRTVADYYCSLSAVFVVAGCYGLDALPLTQPTASWWRSLSR